MKKNLQRNMWMVMCSAILSLFLTGCTIINERYMTVKEAEKFAEELIGEDVTHTMTCEDVYDRRKIYIFKDAKGREFAIENQLSRDQFEAFQYGAYKCHVTENYIAAMVIDNQMEIMEIVEKNDLLPYLDMGSAWETKIYNGESFIADQISFEVMAGTAEENREILMRIAKAGAEIDAIVALTIDLGYEDIAEEKGIRYHAYNDYMGIRVEFEGEKRILDIVGCEFSTSEEARWTQDALFQALYEQIEETEIAPPDAESDVNLALK